MKILESLDCFESLFSRRVWQTARLLLVGAILAPGKRTVSALLRVMGLETRPDYQTYHRVLNRASWSGLKASRLLLLNLLKVFAPQGRLLMGIDDTIERRRGSRIAARGIYRDPVRSSQSHFVKTSGLRWLSLQLLLPIPWAHRYWGLPFLTGLAPSERYNQAHRKRHKRLTDWALQMLLQVRRWLPHREIVVVADSSFACFQLLWRLATLSEPVYLVTRLRLDAGLYDFPAPRDPHRRGRPRLVGPRLPKLRDRLDDPNTSWQPIIISDWYGRGERLFELSSGTALWYKTGMPAVPVRWVLIRHSNAKGQPQALLSTDLNASPQQIIEWFRQRWQLEVTFQEVRAHLGVETQRQWSPLAIARTTPALLALFSIVTLTAHQLQHDHPWLLPKAAWYAKSIPTFVDALALVRQQLWDIQLFQPSASQADVVKIPISLFRTWYHLLCYAA